LTAGQSLCGYAYHHASGSAGRYPQPHPIFPKVIGIDWKSSNIVEFHRRFGNSIRKCVNPPMDGGCGGAQPQRICLQPPHSPWIFPHSLSRRGLGEGRCILPSAFASSPGMTVQSPEPRALRLASPATRLNFNMSKNDQPGCLPDCSATAESCRVPPGAGRRPPMERRHAPTFAHPPSFVNTYYIYLDKRFVRRFLPLPPPFSASFIPCRAEAKRRRMAVCKDPRRRRMPSSFPLPPPCHFRRFGGWMAAARPSGPWSFACGSSNFCFNPRP
jgi:hypothetical protein